MPEEDAVVAITSGLKDMQAVLQLIWDHLRPAMQNAPLAASVSDRTRLRSKLAHLQIATPSGAATNKTALRVAGQSFEFASHPQKIERVGIITADDSVTLLIQSNGREQRIACGYGRWQMGRAELAGFPERPLAAAGAWTTDDTYTARISFYETPYCLTLRLKFAQDELQLDGELNVAFGPTQQPSALGRLTPAR